MKTPHLVKLAASGLAIGLTLTGGHAGPSARTESGSESQHMSIAAKAAEKATKAMIKNNYQSAVSAAEMAVLHQPRDPQYRMLLGQAYLGAGRFASAEASFSDVLTLSPDMSRAALNLVLAQIAVGKNDAAQSTLADYRDKLSASDFGLASALAGDLETGIRTLESAIRGGSNDAKTRQNLALTYAMAGRWANARVMAAHDLTATDLDARIVHWASFVRPSKSADQVASLLGVKPNSDDVGMPTRLALNVVPGTAVAAVEPPVVAQVAAVDAPAAPQLAMAEAPAPEPVFETPAPAPAKAAWAPVAPAPVAPAPVASAPVIRAAAAPVKQVVVPAPRPMVRTARSDVAPAPRSYRSVESGKFVVQLGAFQNAAVSKDAWRRLAPRFGLSGFDPANSAARVGGASYVRLSVGGFTNRAEANGVCARIRSAGGTCFVRGMLGDAPAQWVQRGMPKLAKPIRVASR